MCVSEHYLVKWRLDSCTSISLLLKSLSSFRIAAYRGHTGQKIERSSSGLVHKLQPLSPISTSFQHASCIIYAYLEALNDSTPFFSHITRLFKFLLLKDTKANIQSILGLFGWYVCPFMYNTMITPVNSQDLNRSKHTHKQK